MKFSAAQKETIAANQWLTDRERQVFELHCRRGWAQEDVAAELEISRKTVYNSLTAIRAKCGF